MKEIAKAYKGENQIDGFARLVDLNEIEENDFNLNVSLYVFLKKKMRRLMFRKNRKN